MANPVGRPRKTPAKPDQSQDLEWYGLGQLGYAEAIPLTGSWLRDQLTIEGICFRIGHRPEEGGLGRYRHYKNAVDLIYNHPERESRKKFLWHEWSEDTSYELCNRHECAMAGSSSSGKTTPAALWAVVNFILDPTHVKVLALSTTIKEAKDRIWKEIIEFYEAVPNAPGKAVKSMNQIQGPNYDYSSFGTSSGIYLSAADKSNEDTAYNNMIGTKVPKTGEPGRSAEELLALPEYSDLKSLGFPEDQLHELVISLQEISDDRRGWLIVIIDEATGVSSKLLDAYFSNLKIGNAGRVQMIIIGNPSSRLDTHGTFCEPAAGWGSITVSSTKWETTTGGICIHMDGEKSPRIVSGNERLVWMPTEKDNATLEKKYGRESYEYYRMVRGFWAPGGNSESPYTEADFTQTGALAEISTDGKPLPPAVTWGFQAPKNLCGYDPAFTAGGDRAMATFGKLGTDAQGRQMLEITESVMIKADISNTLVPIPTQLVIKWKQECQKRNVPPENACFDSTGGGISFAAIVSQQWSSRVRAVSSAGKASEKPIGEKDSQGKPIRACDRYANKATELWVAAKDYLRTGQIKNVPRSLAKEICSRMWAKKQATMNLSKKQIEDKKTFKTREKQSPDESDAAFLLLDEAKTRHGFKPSEQTLGLTQGPRDILAPPDGSERPLTSWEQFKNKARRMHVRKDLKKG